MIYDKYPKYDIDVEKGTIYSLKRNKYIGTDNGNGYLMVSKNKLIHRLIWECVNGEIPNGYDVHHIDKNKQNNSIYNLELIEHSKHMSEHSKMFKHTYESKKKISEANKGFKHSEESKKKMSESGKNKIFTRQHKLNLSLSKKGENNAMYGKHHTEDTKRKIKEKNSKKVAQYTLDGNLIKIWDSITDASNEGYNLCCISFCCNGRIKTHKGFIWKYYNEEKDVA